MTKRERAAEMHKHGVTDDVIALALLRGRMWYVWARLVEMWAKDSPVLNPSGGHCIGRRTGMHVYCADCDVAERHLLQSERKSFHQ